MFRSRLFWKLLLAFTALNAVGLAVLGYASMVREQHRAVQSARQEARQAMQLLAIALPGPESGGVDDGSIKQELQRLVVEAQAASGDRFSLIAADGTVLADSSVATLEAIDTIESLGQRPEVVAAMAGDEGFHRRIDANGASVTLSIAQRMPDGGPVEVIRVTRQLDILGLQRTQIAFFLISGVAVAVLFAAAASAIIRHVVRPVLALNEAADAIAQGDHEHRAFVPNGDELGELAQSFNRMSQELGSQLAELREGGQRQATVLGGMIEGVIAVDGRERILFANTAAGKLFGFMPPQVEGRPLLEVVRHHALHQAVASGLSTGKPQRLEAEWEAAERKILTMQITPLPGEPCPGVVVVLHDTTELRRLESLRQDFAANVSHELKTPLSSIKAYTETLLAGAVNDQEHNLKFLARIEEQADRLDNLIQDLLALARIESAQQPFEIQQVAVTETVRACIEDYSKQAEAKQIILVSEPLAKDLHVTADPEGLRVIFNNLIDNAIKYTPIGGQITIRWEQDSERMARIDVTDTGMGIPADALPRLFERFYRVDRARSRELGGTGLGLAIVKHLAQSFGGTVSVASHEGKGSTFTLELPTA